VALWGPELTSQDFGPWGRVNQCFGDVLPFCPKMSFFEILLGFVPYFMTLNLI